MLSALCCRAEPQASDCRRIVSLSPSITEVLYELGLGPRVVGVTRYCLYPSEAQGKPKIGGLLDLSYETIVHLKPNVVFALPEHYDQTRLLERLNLTVKEVNHRSVSGILASITDIGAYCGQQAEAAKIVGGLIRRIDAVSAGAKGKTPKRVMVVIGGGTSTDAISNLYISGKDGFYSELLELAGGRNVYDGPTTNVPLFSAEGILALNPEIILEIFPDFQGDGAPLRAVNRPWQSLPQLRAVQDRRIYLLTGDYVSIPGPRGVLLLEWMAQMIQ